jgi:hypothetical protein
VGLKATKAANDHAVSLELMVQPSTGSSEPIARLEFDGVTDLMVGDLNTLALCHLGVEDISDRQLEGVRYLVWDAEREIISFGCAQWRTT